MKKIITLTLGMMMVFAIIAIPQSQAATAKPFDWGTYFSKNEITAIRRAVADYIQGEIKNKDNDWKGLISGSQLKDNAVGTDKVSSSIAKRKVYTGTIDCSDTGYDVKYGTGEDTEYWKKIHVPEIDISEGPQVFVYSKGNYPALGDDVWASNGAAFVDGYVFILYGGGDPIDCEGYTHGDYKIVVTH